MLNFLHKSIYLLLLVLTTLVVKLLCQSPESSVTLNPRFREVQKSCCAYMQEGPTALQSYSGLE